MKPRTVLALAALGVAIAIGLAALLPRVVDLRETGTPSVARPAGPTPQNEPATIAPMDVEPARPREHALAVGEGSGLQRITVLDEDGRPVLGALAWTEASHGFAQASDAAGVVRLLGDIGVDVYVTADGFLPRRLKVPEQPLELRLERDPGLALTLRWDDGSPVVGARVQPVFEAPILDVARVARLEEASEPTDANGRTMVRPWQIGLLTARLRVDTPDAGRVWLQLPDDIDHYRPATHVARLERGAVGHRVRVVDAQGRPLADRAVTYQLLFDDVGRTDADGWVSFGHQARLQGLALFGRPDLTCSYVIESEPERVWWFEHGLPELRGGGERTLHVLPRRVFGRVESPAPGSYSVATAATPDMSWLGDAQYFPRDFDELIWQRVQDDGSFELLDGWQGPDSFVILRLGAHVREIAVEPVPDGGGPVLLRAPDVCRVTIVSKNPTRGSGVVVLQATSSDRGFLRVEMSSVDSDGESEVSVVRFMGRGSQISLDLPDHPSSFEVPSGHYSVQGMIGENQWPFADLDATGSTATLELDVPALMLVRGRISGSLRGPFAQLAVDLRSEAADDVQRVGTDDDGWFEAHVLARGEIRVTPRWSDDLRYLQLSPGVDLTPALDPQSPVARYEVDEAVLRVIERPPSPLLRQTLWIEAVAPEAGRRASPVKVALDDDGRTELYVPPGTYRLRRRFDAAREQDVQVTLEAMGAREVVLDSSAFAALALSVTVSDPEHRELRLRARDARGSLAALDVEHKLGDGPYEFLKVVEPGTYAVEVESRLKGAASSDEPLDVWRGEITAVPGAQAPLRIHLR